LARAPTIVLAHGFSGSAAMMDPMASALARAGHVVVLPDLPGHGSNAAPLEDGALEPAVSDAVDFAAATTGLPVAVVGHSMGAGAVTSWAVDHPAVATAAVSLPSAEDLPADASRPGNLLILWGALESDRFVDAAGAALRAGYPDAVPGRTYGEFAAGTARRAVSIAGAEHISVIYRQQTFDEVAAWVAEAAGTSGAGDGGAGTDGAGTDAAGDVAAGTDGAGTDAAGDVAAGSVSDQPRGDRRLLGALLVLVGGVLATRPILAMADRPLPVGGRPMTAPGSLAVLAGAAVVASLGAALLQGGIDRIPVAVVGYLLGWFAVGAVLLSLAVRGRDLSVGSAPGAGWGVLAGGVLALAMALPARLTWAAYELVGPRWWVVVALVVGTGGWFWAESRMVAGSKGWRRGGLLVASRLIVVVALLGSVALLGAPEFLALTVPLVVPILLLLAIPGFWARDPAAAAAAQAVPLALVMATTFPLVG
jgi:pimeloyl-ACP methyl ester carboxylesterase